MSEKFVVCDTLLDTTGVTIGVQNPCAVRFFDKWSTSGLPHWVGSGWYAQLFPTEADANEVIAALASMGEDGFKISVTQLEP